MQFTRVCVCLSCPNSVLSLKTSVGLYDWLVTRLSAIEFGKAKLVKLQSAKST